MVKAPLANIITLGVHNFQAERAFYLQLGWPLVLDLEDFAVFELRGALLALFPIEKLARDARATPGNFGQGIHFSIIVNVEAPQDVDEMVCRFRDAGGVVSKEPCDADFFDGRSAYVTDPEGNYWEITWVMPGNSVVAAARRAAGVA
jgi:predicted lactoylglutathione lyase